LKTKRFPKKYRHKKQLAFLKMKVVTGGFKKELFTPTVEACVKKESDITSDGLTSYVGTKEKYNLQSESAVKKT